MKRLVLLILVGMWALSGFATAQFCEIIYDGGVRKSMCSLLLELDSNKFSKIKNRLPKEPSSTALWRKYIGYWKIKNDSLFLDSVLVRKDSDKYRRIFINDIFAKNRTKSGYFANWVNDTIRVVSGDVIDYVHMEWGSTWENEELIAVENGIVKKRICKHNRLVNKGLGDTELKSWLDSLDLGEVPQRIVLRAGYSDFDNKGNPTDCKIIVLRGCGNDDTDNRVVAAIKIFILKTKPFPIYYIDGKYTTLTYTIPISSRKG